MLPRCGDWAFLVLSCFIVGQWTQDVGALGHSSSSPANLLTLVRRQPCGEDRPCIVEQLRHLQRRNIVCTQQCSADQVANSASTTTSAATGASLNITQALNEKRQTQDLHRRQECINNCLDDNSSKGGFSMENAPAINGTTTTWVVSSQTSPTSSPTSSSSSMMDSAAPAGSRGPVGATVLGSSVLILGSLLLTAVDL